MIVILFQEGNLIKRHIMSVSSFSSMIGVDNQCVIYINSPDILSHFPLPNNSKYFNHPGQQISKKIPNHLVWCCKAEIPVSYIDIDGKIFGTNT